MKNRLETLAIEVALAPLKALVWLIFTVADYILTDDTPHPVGDTCPLGCKHSDG